jgi:hypothetical protein
MTVWGEQVLPLAPAAFWNLFVERLRRANKLNLLVKWLPFNDRSKARPRMPRPVCCSNVQPDGSHAHHVLALVSWQISAHVYESLLLAPLRDGDWPTLVARIARWPVLYPLNHIVVAIHRTLAACGLTSGSTWLGAVARYATVRNVGTSPCHLWRSAPF